jgi:hypothetical protein
MSLGRLVVLFLATGMLSVAFTNCGEPVSTTNPLTSGKFSSESDCFFSDEDCDEFAEGDSSVTAIQFYNVDPMPIYTDDNRINIMGGCNAGGFAGAQVFWAMYNAVGEEVDSYNPETDEPVLCDRGEFAFQINVGPTGRFDRSQVHQLAAELRVYKSNGEQVPGNLNTSQSLTLRPSNQ